MSASLFSMYTISGMEAAQNGEANSLCLGQLCLFEEFNYNSSGFLGM